MLPSFSLKKLPIQISSGKSEVQKDTDFVGSEEKSIVNNKDLAFSSHNFF